MLPPSPQEGLINPHYHTHGATSPQSPSNLQPSTSPALISACSMGAIPNHSILHSLPHPPPPIPQAIRVNTKRETFLKKWRTQDTIIQEETFIGIDKWGHVKDKFQQVTWAWNSDIGQQKWRQMIQRWAETAKAKENSAIKNNNTSKSNMASSSICEMTGFERQGPYVTPLPPGGPHKSPLSYPWSNLTPVPFESPTFHLSSSY